MIRKTIAGALLLSLAAGCHGGDTSRAMPRLAGPAGIARAAECHAALQALADAYSRLAERSSGVERGRLANQAIERELDAAAYRLEADRIGAEIGYSGTQVDQLLIDAARERQARPPDTPAGELARQPERCPPPEPGA